MPRRAPRVRIEGIQTDTTRENTMSSPLLLAVSTVDAGTLTIDRAVATAAALVALAGAVVGVRAFLRSAGRGVTRTSLIAVGAGAAGTLAGILVLATADGGPGTGNGVVGGYAGVLLGLIAALSGGLALLRSRRHT
jgi:hypothetical protein